jgi:predicted RNA binding protein YcfA (HicA-like mRNA interferase family)
MPPVPAVRGDKLVRALERAGFEVTRVNGPKGTLRAVLQDTGLTVDELLKFL